MATSDRPSSLGMVTNGSSCSYRSTRSRWYAPSQRDCAAAEDVDIARGKALEIAPASSFEKILAASTVPLLAVPGLGRKAPREERRGSDSKFIEQSAICVRPDQDGTSSKETVVCKRAEDRACPRVGPNVALLSENAHLLGERRRYRDLVAEGARARLDLRVVYRPHVIGGLSPARIIKLPIVELPPLHLADAHGAWAPDEHGRLFARPTLDLGKRGLKNERMKREKEAHQVVI